MYAKNEYFIVVDFEATCTNSREFPSNEMEIIEFAGIIINTKFEIQIEFTEFIKPVRHPRLTKFCTELTSITQLDVDLAKPFPDVLENFKKVVSPYNPLFLSWGNFDKNQLVQDCKFHNCKYPFENHVNIKNEIAKFLKFPKSKGISGTLKYLKLRFEGTPHRGIDDVRNIIRILKEINFPLQDLK